MLAQRFRTTRELSVSGDNYASILKRLRFLLLYPQLARLLEEAG